VLPKTKQMYRDAKQVHHLLIEDLTHLGTEVSKCSLADQIDTVYSLKKTEDLLDDARKEMKKVRAKLETKACLSFYTEAIESFKTVYCSAKVKIKQFANFPHKRRNDPEKFDKIMHSLGVPANVVDCEAVRLNWEGFAEWFSKRQAAGLPLPEGVVTDETYTIYELATRKILDVDEEVD